MQVRHESHNIGGGRRRRQGQRRQQVQARKGEECTCVFMLEADSKERGAGGHGRVRSQRTCQRHEFSKVGQGLKLVHRFFSCVRGFFRVFVVSVSSPSDVCSLLAAISAFPYHESYLAHSRAQQTILCMQSSRLQSHKYLSRRSSTMVAARNATLFAGSSR